MDLDDFNKSRIPDYYERAFATAISQVFLFTDQFLIDLSDHDLLDTLLKHIRQFKPTLSQADLEEQLLTALASLYTEGFFAPNEFAE